MLQVCTMPAQIQAALYCCNLIQPTHLSSGLWILIQWDWFLGVVFNQRFSLCHRCGINSMLHFLAVHERTPNVTSLLNHGRCYKFAQCLRKFKLHFDVEFNTALSGSAWENTKRHKFAQPRWMLQVCSTTVDVTSLHNACRNQSCTLLL